MWAVLVPPSYNVLTTLASHSHRYLLCSRRARLGSVAFDIDMWKPLLFPVLLLWTVASVRSQSLCLKSTVVLDRSEWGVPEYYIKCDNGVYLALSASKDRRVIYDPPLCLEGDIQASIKLKCSIYENDVFFDDYLGSFEIADWDTMETDKSVDVTVEDSFIVEVQSCTCEELRRKKTT